MKFYNREKELLQLAEIRQRSFDSHSQMTVVTGRRRIGKTKLILKSCEHTPAVYLIVSRNNEATLRQMRHYNGGGYSGHSRRRQRAGAGS